MTRGGNDRVHACPPNPFLVHQILCFRTIAQVDKKIPTWAPQLRVGKVNLSLFCFLHSNKIVQVEWISPAGRVDFGRRLTLCPRKLLPLKDTVTLLYPMGKAYPNSAPITGLSDPVGGGANSGATMMPPIPTGKRHFSKFSQCQDSAWMRRWLFHPGVLWFQDIP